MLGLMNNDNQDDLGKGADEEITDGASSLGHAPEDTEDIDATLKSVGLPSDDNGPHELNSQKVLDRADQKQE